MKQWKDALHLMRAVCTISLLALAFTVFPSIPRTHFNHRVDRNSCQCEQRLAGSMNSSLKAAKSSKRNTVIAWCNSEHPNS